MGSKLISVRCPADLLDKLEDISQFTHCSRNAVIVGAIRLFCQHAQAQGGKIIPPYAKDIDVSRSYFSFNPKQAASPKSSPPEEAPLV